MGLEDGKQDNNNQIGSDEEQIDDEESQSISKTSRAQPCFLRFNQDFIVLNIWYLYVLVIKNQKRIKSKNEEEREQDTKATDVAQRKKWPDNTITGRHDEREFN